ncbi:MAG TPA: LLM class flavin-dependent oxidoreductase [Methylomirabilota bacterium]|nr:LLM class flavin-dependent oxidoreductase [Methylomirabilota bacterium]
MAAALGVAFDGRNPLAVLREQAQAAERAGADTLWVSSHLFLRDPFTSAATVLTATTRVRVALMAVSPHVMHPVHVAMGAATLEELAPGRVVLCVGTGAPNDLADAGVVPQRPLATLRETVELVRLLLAGEPVTYKGEVFRVDARRLAPGGRPIPVVLAAVRPRSLELAGGLADGVLLSNASSVEFIRASLEHVARSGGARPLRRAGLVYAAVAEREADALGRFRRQLAITLRAPHHSSNLALAGATLDQDAVRRALAREDWTTVEALVSDEVVRRHTASGTPEQVRARLAAYHAAGLDEIVLGGLYTPEETARAVATARGAA